MAAKLIANVTKRLISPPAANTEYAQWVNERELHTHSVMCVHMYVCMYTNTHANMCVGISFMNEFQRKQKRKEQPVSGK